MDRTDWWRRLDPALTEPLRESWIAVGSPGFAGADKARWRAVLDDRFGEDGWRLAHCGDAFIAYLLADWWRAGDLVAAVDRGKIGGALPTAWVRPLPDSAYGKLLARG